MNSKSKGGMLVKGTNVLRATRDRRVWRAVSAHVLNGHVTQKKKFVKMKCICVCNFRYLLYVGK